MQITVLGAGAVGGYYAAMLARAGHDVAVVARGAHLSAIRERGLAIKATRGDFVATVRAEADAGILGTAELVILAVKTYDNASALPSLAPLTGPATTVLTLQNGVDSPSEAARIVGESRVIGGAAYIATALTAPGVIEQTGLHHRIVFGEIFGDVSHVSARVAGLRDMLAAAAIEAEAHADARVPLWEKFIYLGAFAGMTGAARLPIGPLRARPDTVALLVRAFEEIEQVARAEGVAVAPDVVSRIRTYLDALPGSTRSSLLIDLQQGKRTEVEALQGAVVRRARVHGIDVPVMETLYAVLREHA